MKAWSWFAVIPLTFTLVYTITPMMVSSTMDYTASAVSIAPLDLPVAQPKAISKGVDSTRQDIDYTAFGDLTTNRRGKPVPVEPTLQSILMTERGGVAVVDGIKVHQGDMIGDGYRVLRIEPLAVVLGGKQTTNVTVGNKVKQVSKNSVKVLRFPEYRDSTQVSNVFLDGTTPSQLDAARNRSVTLTPAQSELENKYKQILEKLKL